jgi:tetratricopeptide (TPR) repeat protein
MSLQDRLNHDVTGATPKALELYEKALEQFQCYRGDPLGTIDQALLDAPGFVMARCLKGYLGVLATEKPGFEMARGEVTLLEGARGTDREAGHRAALRALSAGDWEEGIAILDAVLAASPRDIVALQAVHLANFYVGDAKNLRDSVARVRGEWNAELPGYHAVLGMHAFGLEECGDYARAEREGRAALALNPYDAWAHHAVVHVLEMQGRVEEGAEWVASREAHWAVENFFAIHNWWHLALFHLDRGDVERVLGMYDRSIRGTKSKVVLDMVDASQLLWRLQLRGVDVRSRSQELAEAWAPLTKDGLYAFNDAHAAMAFLAAGRSDLFGELKDTMTRQAASGTGSNAVMTRDVGLPVVNALAAFADGDHAKAVEILRRVRPVAHRFGGSHAQRDIIDQTLCEAALRGGKRELALALAREREEWKPGHTFGRALRARAMAVPA